MHYSAISSNGVKSLQEGQAVQFTLVMGPKGWHGLTYSLSSDPTNGRAGWRSIPLCSSPLALDSALHIGVRRASRQTPLDGPEYFVPRLCLRPGRGTNAVWIQGTAVAILAELFHA